MQIESNISPELTTTFDRWKDNHGSSEKESEKENKAPANPDVTTAAAALKVTLDMLKAVVRLQSFVDTLTKLDQKLIEDWNACKCDAKEAARSLKCSSSTIGLSDGSQCAPYSRGQSSSTTHTQTSSSSSSYPPKLTDHKRKYLETYNGCKKCQGFYMLEGHACEFPSSDGYIVKTMATVNKACKCIKLPTLPIPQDKMTMYMNAMSNLSSSSNIYAPAPAQPSVAPPALPITTMHGMSAYPIASVCLPNKSSILDGGESNLSHDSNVLVSTHVPFFLPHC